MDKLTYSETDRDRLLYRKTDRQTDRHTDKQTDKQTRRQWDKQSHRESDRQAYKQVGKQVERSRNTDRQAQVRRQPGKQSEGQMDIKSHLDIISGATRRMFFHHRSTQTIPLAFQRIFCSFLGMQRNFGGKWKRQRRQTDFGWQTRKTHGEWFSR